MPENEDRFLHFKFRYCCLIFFIFDFSVRFVQLCDPYHSSRFLFRHSVIVWINFRKKMCRSRCLLCITGTLLLISNNWNWFLVLVLLLVAAASSFAMVSSHWCVLCQLLHDEYSIPCLLFSVFRMRWSDIF